MDDRIGMNSSEARELKLGTTFSTHHNAFHTLKYDFKPASVDLNKEATVDVGSNNQVQVTVPHLDGSGVPKTVFKGNQKKYTKECVLIIDKTTGEFTLERLTNNISVKKTRSETAIKSNGQLGGGGPSTSSSLVGGVATVAAPSMKLSENSTQRTVSKTRVSTGVRKTNAITGFMSKPSPGQGSPIYPHNHHKSPQSAPAWNANNGQSTLPSIPMIDDDVMPMSGGGGGGGGSSSMAPIQEQHSHLMHQPHLNPQQHTQQQQHQPAPEIMSSSDSSSESSYSSDSDSSHHSTTNAGHNNNVGSKAPPSANLLKEDLCLSDSNSSDSD